MGLRRVGLVAAALAVAVGCRDGDGADVPAGDGTTTSAVDAVESEAATAADGSTGGADGPSRETDGGTDDPPGPPPADEVYPDIVTLQALAINPTCSLNNGVCHNGNNYPDLHTINNVVSTVGARCGTEVVDVDLIFDVCEPPGDRLVIASAGFDAEIMSVTVSPNNADYEDLETATITVGGDASGVKPGAADVTATRGEQVFDLGAHGVSVVSVSEDTIELELVGNYGRWSAKRFLDIRELPWTDDKVRVADPNGNGVAGAADSTPIIAPGDPWGSYAFLRLIDEQYGDLMPRQCRTWDDRATHALGCWIEGLVEEEGELVNAYDPIDYDACTVDVEGMGRCETLLGTDLAAMEQIFAARCGGSGCHLGEGMLAEGLDLSEGMLLQSLVDVPSVRTGIPLVAPGDPEQSYLLCKLSAACDDRTGAVMPTGADPLPDEEIAAIQAWIAAGANG